MSLITWNDSLIMDVEIIDSQHKKLVDLINELNDAMKEGKGDEIVLKVVNGLVDYTKEHFKTEERYFESFSYEYKDNHKIEHDQFVLKVSDFQEKLSEGSAILSIEILNFLMSWLTNHIKNEDKKYIELFKSKGL